MHVLMNSYLSNAQNTTMVAQECPCSDHFVLPCGAGYPKQMKKFAKSWVASSSSRITE